VRVARKHIGWYLDGRPGAQEARRRLMRCERAPSSSICCGPISKAQRAPGRPPGGLMSANPFEARFPEFSAAAGRRLERPARQRPGAGHARRGPAHGGITLIVARSSHQAQVLARDLELLAIDDLPVVAVPGSRNPALRPVLAAPRHHFRAGEDIGRARLDPTAAWCSPRLNALAQRLPPADYMLQRSLRPSHVGQHLVIEAFRQRLQHAGYDAFRAGLPVRPVRDSRRGHRPVSGRQFHAVPPRPVRRGDRKHPPVRPRVAAFDRQGRPHRACCRRANTPATTRGWRPSGAPSATASRSTPAREPVPGPARRRAAAGPGAVPAAVPRADVLPARLPAGDAATAAAGRLPRRRRGSRAAHDRALGAAPARRGTAGAGAAGAVFRGDELQQRLAACPTLLIPDDSRDAGSRGPRRRRRFARVRPAGPAPDLHIHERGREPAAALLDFLAASPAACCSRRTRRGGARCCAARWRPSACSWPISTVSPHSMRLSPSRRPPGAGRAAGGRRLRGAGARRDAVRAADRVAVVRRADPAQGAAPARRRRGARSRIHHPQPDRPGARRAGGARRSRRRPLPSASKRWRSTAARPNS
jgi:hypothetical protein